MWIKFSSHHPFMIKIYIGGINAVSGEWGNEDMATKLCRTKLLSRQEIIQDYVVTPKQPWLDGFATANGIVRQFVAMPQGSEYSVEAQVTGSDRVKGIQFEITPSKLRPPHIYERRSA